jgi:hypothetical protein
MQYIKFEQEIGILNKIKQFVLNDFLTWEKHNKLFILNFTLILTLNLYFNYNPNPESDKKTDPESLL